MGRTLVIVGLSIAGLGVLVMIGLPLGRLPGDFVYRRGNTSLYAPIATSVLLSLMLTVVLLFLRR